MLHAKFHGNQSTGSGEDILRDFSSPEPLGSKGDYSIPIRPASVHHFQRSSPLKPLGQSKPNFMWSLLGKGERKFI